MFSALHPTWGGEGGKHSLFFGFCGCFCFPVVFLMVFIGLALVFVGCFGFAYCFVKYINLGVVWWPWTGHQNASARFSPVRTKHQKVSATKTMYVVALFRRLCLFLAFWCPLLGCHTIPLLNSIARQTKKKQCFFKCVFLSVVILLRNLIGNQTTYASLLVSPCLLFFTKAPNGKPNRICFSTCLSLSAALPLRLQIGNQTESASLFVFPCLLLS